VWRCGYIPGAGATVRDGKSVRIADVGGETGLGTGGIERRIGWGRRLVIGPADSGVANRATTTTIDIDPSILIASLRSETRHHV